MKKALIILAVLAFIASLVANVLLADAAKTFYRREAAFRLHPSGMPSFEQSGAFNLPRVLLLGDSRMAHWTTFMPAKYCAINGGVGNETTAQILLRAKDAIKKSNPAVVVIQAGINDLKVIPVLPAKEKEITDDCAVHLMELAKTARDSGAAVVVLGVLPAGKVDWTRWLVWSDAVNNSVKTVNNTVAAACQGAPRTAFLDLSGEASVGRDYVDTLHFNTAFYQRITPMVGAKIDVLLANQRP